MRFVDDVGRVVETSVRLGSGGEGVIWAVVGEPDSAVKIYSHPSHERLAKLQAMIAKPPADPTASQSHRSICWPTSLLYDHRRVPVGFIMPRVDSASNLLLFKLYHPLDRQREAPEFTWRYLFRTAANLASAVAAIHSGGYVIGDLNESNIFVTNTALISLVDCDSMQVPQSETGVVFRCPVGKAEFTAPELQGFDLGSIDRAAEHDAFSLGVLLFLLLMEGTHPFSGIWMGAGDPPAIEDRIRLGASPYAGSPLVASMRNAPPFTILPPALQDLFRVAFLDGHRAPTERPTADRWWRALTTAEVALRVCSVSTQHTYSSHLGGCPWCDRTRLLGGRDPFGPAPPTRRPLVLTSASAGQPMPAGTTAAPQSHVQQAGAPRRRIARVNAILGGVAALALLFLVAYLGGWVPTDSSTAVPKAAPLQIVDRGACPFEGCTYGEDWMAKHDVDVYAAPPEAVETPSSRLRRVTMIRKGSWVRTEGGLVLSRRGSGRVNLSASETAWRKAKGLPHLRNGDPIPIYTYLGEGCVRTWIPNQLLTTCNPIVEIQPKNEWWIHIKTARGIQVWTNSADSFISRGGLNTQLAELIADPQMSGAAKLVKIDDLLKLGADLNGSGGKYGTDPIRAAVETADVDLFKALMSKGLAIRNDRESCTAYHAPTSWAKPNGDLMLEYLLQNGMQLDCLQEPPFHAFLRWGILSKDYPVEQAIKVAEVLSKSGADLSRRDSTGQSILDMIDSYLPSHPRLAALRQALVNLRADRSS